MFHFCLHVNGELQKFIFDFPGNQKKIFFLNTLQQLRNDFWLISKLMLKFLFIIVLGKFWDN